MRAGPSSPGGAGSRFLVADTMRQLPTPVFENRDAALATLEHVKQGSGGQPRFPDVVRSVSADQPVRSLFITDGVAGTEPPRNVQTISVFEPADNVGITAFDVRAQPGNPRRYEAFVEVLNASAGNKRVELRVAGAGGKAISKNLRLAGRTASSEVLDVSGFDGGPLRVTVTTDSDTFALDDNAFAFLPSKRVVRVALVTGGNPQLQHALELLPRVQLTVLTPERSSAARGFDVAVFDRYAPRDEPHVPALLIRPPAVAWLPKHVGAIADTSIARWDRTHPLLRQTSLRDIAVESADLLKPGAVAGGLGGHLSVLAMGPQGQALIIASEGGARWVELAFGLDQSSFPQQASFPMFLANALDWLTDAPQALSRELGTVQVPAAHAKVVDLEGREVKVRQVPGATLFEVAQPGFFAANSEGRRLYLAANLLDPRVSAINETRLTAQPQDARSPQAGAHLAVDPWLVLLVIAVALLTIEWLTYNRRVTI